MVTKVKSDYLITRAEAKAHLRVDTTSEDTYIDGLVKAAVEYCENIIQKDIATTAVTILIEKFSGAILDIDQGNVTAITSIKDGDTVLAYDDEPVEWHDAWFRVELNEAVSEKDIEIKLATGYTTATLPATIKQAILIKIADLYDIERNSYNITSINLNRAIDCLLASHCAIRVRHIKN